MDILTYINKMNRLYGSEQQVASLPYGTQGTYGVPEETPMPNIQDLIREEGVQVGPQVKDGGRIYDTRKYFKPGGLVEPGVTHYATLTKAEETANINAWEERMKVLGKKYADVKDKQVRYKIRQGIGGDLPTQPIGPFKYPINTSTGTVYTDKDYNQPTKAEKRKVDAWEKANPGQKYADQHSEVKFQIRKKGAKYKKLVEFLDKPGVEKRAIELLNEGHDATTVAKTLETEGLVKYTMIFDKSKGKKRKNLTTARRAFKQLLEEGKLEVDEIAKSLGTDLGAKEIKIRDDAIVKAYKESPDLSADRIAKRLTAQLGMDINPGVVVSSLKRRGIDYTTRDAKILKEVEALDKIVKNNRTLIGGNQSYRSKTDDLLQLFKDAMKNQKITPETFAYRLERLGQLYTGTGVDRTVDKIYKNIKPPTNYIDSGLQKGIVQLLDQQWVGVVDKAKLLGLPRKEIKLLEDVYSGVGHLAGKIKMAGDHTDIWGMMKDFSNYRKNFTRITMITDELNQLKRSYDQSILKEYRDLKAFEGANNPNAINARNKILGNIDNLQKEWMKSTGLNIGKPSVDAKGKLFMEFTTERLPDIDSPRNTTLKNTMEHLMEQKGVKFSNVVDQEILKGGNLKKIFDKFKGTKEIANSKYVQSLGKMGGRWGTLAKALVYGTIGAGGMTALATAATPKHELIEGAKEKGMPMPTIKETAAALGLSKLSGKFGGVDPFKYLRKGLRKIGSSLLTPTGALAAWPLAAMGAEKLTGEKVPVFDPKDPWSRGALGLELGLAPALVTWTEKLTKPIKNQALRSGVQKGLNLMMNPKTAMRVARFASPIGWATLAGEAAYQGGKFMYGDYQKRKDAIETMWKEEPEKMQQLALEASETMRDDKSAMFNTGGRVPFGKGKIATTVVDKGRRAFMKWLAGLTGAGVVAGTGLIKFGKIFGKGETVIKAGDHIMQGTPGMPDWFIPLVNRIVKEGDDVTKKLGTIEREIVHTKKIGKGEFADEVTVYQDMNTGNVRVEYKSRHSMGEGYEPVQLEYRAGEVITEGKHAGKKTNPEFDAVEPEPVGRASGPDDYSIEWDGENVVGNVDDLMSDTSKLKQFATKKKPTINEIVKSRKKKIEVQKVHENESDYIVKKQGDYADYDDYLPDIDDLD